jgi:hypothetical protein
MDAINTSLERSDSVVTTFPSSDSIPQKRSGSPPMNPKKKERRRFLGSKPQALRLPLTINPSSSSHGIDYRVTSLDPIGERMVSDTDTFAPADATSQAVIRRSQTSPSQYRPILKEDQGGTCMVAHQVDPLFALVTIKSTERKNARNLHPTDHPNVVNLLAFYDIDATTYLVYECMDISLAEVQASPNRCFEAFELAAICTEVSTQSVVEVPIVYLRHADTRRTTIHPQYTTSRLYNYKS